MKKKLLVVGGGAAGFFCAVTAARMNPDFDVTIAEKSNKLLSKVKISGGERCNVTHACFEIDQMIRNYPRGGNFLKKAFHQFFTTDTIEWFRKRGVKLKAEEDGRMFPVTDSSQTIIDCLMREASELSVQIIMNAEVKNIVPLQDSFQIEFSLNRTPNYFPSPFGADCVCIATGGYPKSSMFDWLKQLGHTVEEPVPSLFTFNTPGHNITALMGISVPCARVKIVENKLEQTGPVLITHWGLSGPAVLKLSAWGARDLAKRKWIFTVRINWIQNHDESLIRKKIQAFRVKSATQKIYSKNDFGLPQRLWEFLCLISEIKPEWNWADLPAKFQNKLINNLFQFELQVKGKTTFKEEFVTAGGIKLSEVDSNTMMSKKVKNLFFAGEVMDVDGITGGFNFQHAWTSGFIAGRSVAGLESKV